jgi:hypothetical protein
MLVTRSPEAISPAILVNRRITSVAKRMLVIRYVFAGSDEGAERTAILCTVIESAARHGLDLRLYLQDILLKLAAGWPPERLDELLPHRWCTLHADAARATELAETQPNRAAA